jgi:hypothetical protein
VQRSPRGDRAPKFGRELLEFNWRHDDPIRTGLFGEYWIDLVAGCGD